VSPCCSALPIFTRLAIKPGQTERRIAIFEKNNKSNGKARTHPAYQVWAYNTGAPGEIKDESPRTKTGAVWTHEIGKDYTLQLDLI
jgi:hypothetical protein